MKYVKYVIISAVFILSGITYSREVPLIKRWLLNKIQLISREKTGVEIKAQTLEFALFPPGIELNQLHMKFREKALAQTLSPIQIDRLKISLSPFAFLSGRFEIGNISIEHPRASFFVNKSESKTETKPVVIPWKSIINVPVRRIEVRNAEFQSKLEVPGLFIKSQGLNLNFEKDSSAAKLEIFSPKTFIKKFHSESSFVEMGMATRILMEEQALEISAIKLSLGPHFVIGRGVTRGDITKLQWNTLNFHIISHLGLEDVTSKLNTYFEGLKIPKSSGVLNLEVIASQKRGEPALASAEIDTQALEIKKIKIGNIHSKLKFSKNTLTTDLINLKTTAGNVSIKDFTLSTVAEHKISSRLQTSSIDLKQLLINLDVGNIPLNLDVGLKTACEGVLSPHYKIECAGEATGSNFKISTPENKTIAALKEFKIISRFILENERMSFPEGEIHIGTSSGTGSGFVDFEKGFQFNFNTDHLDFKNIQNLASLKYEGAIQLHGVTKGNGHSATIETHVGMNDFWFEDYGLGKGEFNLTYKDSHLLITDIQGEMQSSAYTGNVDLNLNSPINIKADINFPKLNLRDLKTAFSLKANLPFDVDGQGAGKIELNGPLSLSDLNYTLKSRFDSGSIYNENFQNFNFDLHGVNGHAFADSITLKKGEGTLVLNGDITSKGIMNLTLKGQDLHLSDFEHVRKTSNSLDGLVQVDLTLKDKILSPRLSMKGLISQSSLGQEPLENSTFNLELNPDNMQFDFNLFADQLKGNLTQPRKGKGPFQFKFDAENWNFAKFLSVISGTDFKKDFETNTTAHVHLTSDSGDFWESRGEIKIPTFFVRHGVRQMQNSTPLIAKFNDGFVSIENAALKGDNTLVNISGSRTKKDNLNISINGHLELSLFTFLTPFFKDMHGMLTISSQIAGTTSKPEFLGTALISKGYFALQEFPHAFEDINADVLFSQSRIVINKVKGILGGGDLESTGSILFRGPKDIPIDISGTLSHATLSVPEGLTTKGTGTFSINGNWPPYTLHSDINIENGLYTKNFGEQESNINIKRSAFLPKNISQKQTYPLDLDLRVHFPKGVAVKNSLLEADVKGDITITGEPKHSLIKGEISTLPNGKLFFRETPFNIDVAKVKFNNPNENNPNIYLLGSTRVRDWDITLLYQGNLDTHELKLTSSPQLSERSIISLLALGITDDNLEKNKSSDQLAIQSYQAGSVILATNPLIQDFKKKTGVTVRLSPTVDDTKNAVMPRFIAEKQWTPKFSTSVSRTLGEKSARDVNAEFKLNRNFSVLGFYEQRDYDQFSVTNATGASSSVNSSVQPSNYPDILGLDLQYQMEFR